MWWIQLQVAIRAFFPVWVFLYVIQFVLWPVIARDNLVSSLFGNTIYLVAMGYYTIITFLGYNGTLMLYPIENRKCPRTEVRNLDWTDTRNLALPFLHHTELLLSPAVLFAILWFVSLFGFNIPKHVGPLLILGAR